MDPYQQFIKERAPHVPSHVWGRLGSKLELFKENGELNGNIAKRLSPRSMRMHKDQIPIFVHLILASQGYEFSHHTTKDISYSAFLHAWSHLGTLVTASSPSLSAILRACLDGRTVGGFMKATGIQLENEEKDFAPDMSLIELPWVRVDVDGDYLTINHMMVCDRCALKRRGPRLEDFENMF